jgi:hypothetical protein
VVAVAVEPDAAGMCALGVALVAAFTLEEVVAAENLMTVVFQCRGVNLLQVY